MTETAQARHEAFTDRHLAGRVEPEYRAGVRSGLDSAAHLCNAIAADIEASTRKSKRRDEVLAAIRQCGDAIWQMRDRALSSPTPSSGIGGVDGR